MRGKFWGWSSTEWAWAWAWAVFPSLQPDSLPSEPPGKSSRCTGRHFNTASFLLLTTVRWALLLWGCVHAGLSPGSHSGSDWLTWASGQLPAAFRLSHTAQLSFLAPWFAKVSSVYLALFLLRGGCKTKDNESNLQC